MFIAHLPAGYIAAALFEDHWCEKRLRSVFVAILVGSVFPDLDMLYFYLIDQGRRLHHHYWTHLPLFWLLLLAAAIGAARFFRLRFTPAVIAFVAGVFLHLLLDTPFGGILWLAPFSDHTFPLVTVPATSNWWVWSFVFHWSFTIEIAICVAAAVLYFTRRVQGARRSDGA